MLIITQKFFIKVIGEKIIFALTNFYSRCFWKQHIFNNFVRQKFSKNLNEIMIKFIEKDCKNAKLHLLAMSVFYLTLL